MNEHDCHGEKLLQQLRLPAHSLLASALPLQVIAHQVHSMKAQYYTRKFKEQTVILQKNMQLFPPSLGFIS